MSFYMITYGQTQVEKFYIGKTQGEVVKNARELIDQWWEYSDLTDDEIIEMAESDQFEFDLVEINAEWSSHKNNEKYLIALYEFQYSGRVPSLPKPKISDYL